MGEATVITGQIFNGVSLASILLLAAMGLALSFGVMNVINMAHGEMLMMGGYLSYLVCHMVHGPGAFAQALVVAFAGASILGAILEITVVRWLYGRPLDTLLATWGISLILQQSARSIFGAIGVDVVAPSWLSGSISVKGGMLAGLTLPYVRVFMIALSGTVLAAVFVFIKKTRWGLLLRAVHQDREMAEALGINSHRVDFIVFALGSGIAGLAGATLAMISPVTPTVGQSYIVYAFLVVIMGGMGSLGGTALAALVVGLFSSGLQIVTSVSFADVLLLVMVIVFIQFRPQGLIVRRSRALEG
jgi:urea transport system permease protein